MGRNFDEGKIVRVSFKVLDRTEVLMITVHVGRLPLAEIDFVICKFNGRNF